MFNLFDIEVAPSEIVQLLQRLQNWTISDIARRIRKNGYITSSAEYRLTQASEVRLFDVSFREELRKILGITNQQIDALFAEAAQAGYIYDKRVFQEHGIAYIPFSENYALQRLIRTISEQTQGQMINMTRSLGFAVKTPLGLVFKPVAKFYQEELDLAMTKILTGTETADQAIRQAVKKMTESGLRTVDYSTGHSDRIDVAARRAVMSGLRDATNAQSEFNAQQMSLTTFELSWHGGHRPNHRWGGRRYDTTGRLYPVERRLYELYPGPDGSVGTPEDFNCYHIKYAVFPDTPPTYSDEQLRAMEAKELEVRVFQDKAYNSWEARKMQRKMERAMRLSRSKIAGYEGGMLPEELWEAKTKYTLQRSLYKNFSEAMDIPTEFNRVYTGTV